MSDKYFVDTNILLSGAGVLYSEDLATGQKYGAVQVMNPLLASATSI